MIEEIISKEIILYYNPSSINPIDINEHYLQEIGVIDGLNKLDRGMLRIGSLGTNIIFANDSKDEIRVQPSLLKIESKNEDRLFFILEKFKDKFGSVTLQRADFSFDSHLIDDQFPDIIFSNYTTTTGMELGGIQFKYENIDLLMYSCGPNKIHLKTVIQNRIGKQLNDIDIKRDLQLEKLHKFYADFKEKDLKINIES